MSKIVKPKPVVRIERGESGSSGKWLVALLIAVGLTSALLAYNFGPFKGGSVQSDDNSAEMLAELEKRVAALKEENERLVRENAFTKRSSEIDKKANIALVDALSDREKKAAQTKEELGFYKNIVSDKGVGKGLEIRTLELSSGTQSTDYSYKLVLSRTGTKKTAVKGSIVFRVQGRMSGTSKTLGWHKIRADRSSAPVFNFQYFQTLEGNLRLPADFVPENILVRVSADGSDQPVQQSYSWNAIVKGGEKT